MTKGIDPWYRSGTVSATYNSANQIVTWNGVSHAYDADGNWTGSGDGKFSAVYDAEGRLTRIVRNGAATDYLYDGINRRIRSTGPAGTRNYHYDHLGRLLFVTDGRGTVVCRFIYLGQRVQALQTAGGEWLYYHFNKNGSTLALTGESGEAAVRYAYLPYGQVTVSGRYLENPFTFVGAYGVTDEGRGLYYMRQRFYDAAIGRFLQRDPIGYEGGINLYAYAGGNPVNYIDPTGTNFFSNLYDKVTGALGWKSAYDSTKKAGKKIDAMMGDSHLAFHERRPGESSSQWLERVSQGETAWKRRYAARAPGMAKSVVKAGVDILGAALPGPAGKMAGAFSYAMGDDEDNEEPPPPEQEEQGNSEGPPPEDEIYTGDLPAY